MFVVSAFTLYSSFYCVRRQIKIHKNFERIKNEDNDTTITICSKSIKTISSNKKESSTSKLCKCITKNCSETKTETESCLDSCSQENDEINKSCGDEAGSSSDILCSADRETNVCCRTPETRYQRNVKAKNASEKK